jgi:hypothetical protein
LVSAKKSITRRKVIPDLALQLRPFGPVLHIVRMAGANMRRPGRFYRAHEQAGAGGGGKLLSVTTLLRRALVPVGDLVAAGLLLFMLGGLGCITK